MNRRAPDVKLKITRPVQRASGRTSWLPIGTISLWLDKSTQTYEGSAEINLFGDASFRLFPLDQQEPKT